MSKTVAIVACPICAVDKLVPPAKCPCCKSSGQYAFSYEVEEMLTRATNGHPPRREFAVTVSRPYPNIDGGFWSHWILDLPDLPQNSDNHGRCDPPCHVSSRMCSRLGPARWSVFVVYAETCSGGCCRMQIEESK